MRRCHRLGVLDTARHTRSSDNHGWQRTAGCRREQIAKTLTKKHWCEEA